MKKLSVIVPVYNVEKYLERCVNSVINQNYPYMEIILIDDGSKDSSGKICDILAAKDNRIKVIHQQNGGLSAARNTGIDNATGEYIDFLDSDDELLPNVFNDLIPLLEYNKLDLIVFASQKVKPEKINKEKHTGKFSILDGKEALIKEISENGGCAWNKIYTRKAIGDVRFPVGRLFEDTAVSYKFIANCDKIGIVDKVYHNYYYNPNSIANTSFNVKARWDFVLAREEIYKYCLQHNLPYENANSFLIKALLSCLTAIYANGDNGDYYKNINEMMDKYKCNYSYKCLNLKYKLFLFSYGKFDFIHKIGAKLSKYTKIVQRKFRKAFKGFENDQGRYSL